MYYRGENCLCVCIVKVAMCSLLRILPTAPAGLVNQHRWVQLTLQKSFGLIARNAVLKCMVILGGTAGSCLVQVSQNQRGQSSRASAWGPPCCPWVWRPAHMNVFSIPVSRAFIFWQNKESSRQNNWEGCHDQGPSAAVTKGPWESWQCQPATGSVRALHRRCYRRAFTPDLAHQQPDSWGEEGRKVLEGKHRWVQLLFKLWLIHYFDVILLLELSKSALAHITLTAHFQSTFHGQNVRPCA